MQHSEPRAWIARRSGGYISLCRMRVGALYARWSALPHGSRWGGVSAPAELWTAAAPAEVLQCCYSWGACTHALCRIRYRTSLPTERHFIPKVFTVDACARRAVCAGPAAGQLLRATQADRTEVCVPNDYIHPSSALWLVLHWNSPSRAASLHRNKNLKG